MSDVLAFIFVGPLALIRYCCRNGTKLGWYRGAPEERR